jgi:hypothetical protein
VASSKTIHLVTALSRPQNLFRIWNSIRFSLAKSDLDANWIVVADRWSDLVTFPFPLSRRLEITRIVDTEHKPCPYGIRQKNLGMSLIKKGYYHCLDDDNIVHPDFFYGIEHQIDLGTKGICFNQRRWDMLGTLEADPKKMGYGEIDNTMFVVSIDVICHRRYILEDAGKEDWLFFSKLYEQSPTQFVFLKKVLAYYNYIRQFPIEPVVGFDEVPR